MFFCNVVSRWAQLVSFLCRMFNYHGLSDLQVQNLENKVQLKLKLLQLWRIALWLSRLQLSVFPNIVWVFWLERVISSLVFWIRLTVFGLFCYCLCNQARPWFRFSTRASLVARLGLCLLAFTRATLVVLYRGENVTARREIASTCQIQLVRLQ